MTCNSIANGVYLDSSLNGLNVIYSKLKKCCLKHDKGGREGWNNEGGWGGVFKVYGGVEKQGEFVNINLVIFNTL